MGREGERTSRFICPSFITSCLLPEPSEFPSSPWPGLLSSAHTDAPARTHTTQRREKPAAEQLPNNSFPSLCEYVSMDLPLGPLPPCFLLNKIKISPFSSSSWKSLYQAMANTFSYWPRSTPQTWMVFHGPRASPPCSQRSIPVSTALHQGLLLTPDLCKPCWVNLCVLS